MLYQHMPTVGQSVLITYQKAKVHECTRLETGRQCLDVGQVPQEPK